MKKFPLLICHSLNLIFWGLLILLTASGCNDRPRFFYDFEQSCDLDRLLWQCGVEFALSSKYVTSGNQSLKVTIHPPHKQLSDIYPGVTFLDFDNDWRNYKRLAFDIFSMQPEPFNLVLRIDDTLNPDYRDRYNSSIIITPGYNQITIPLTDLVATGTKRKLKLNNINSVSFFLASPRKKHSFFLDNCRIM